MRESPQNPSPEDQETAFELLAKGLKRTSLPTSTGEYRKNVSPEEFMLMPSTQDRYWMFKHAITRNYLGVNRKTGKIEVFKSNKPFFKGEFDSGQPRKGHTNRHDKISGKPISGPDPEQRYKKMGRAAKATVIKTISQGLIGYGVATVNGKKQKGFYFKGTRKAAETIGRDVGITVYKIDSDTYFAPESRVGVKLQMGEDMSYINEQKRLAGIGPRYEWTVSEGDTEVSVDIDQEPEADGEGDEELDEAADPADLAAELLDKGVRGHFLFKEIDKKRAEVEKAMAAAKKANDGLRKVGAGDTEAQTLVQDKVVPALKAYANIVTKVAENVEKVMSTPRRW